MTISGLKFTSISSTYFFGPVVLPEIDNLLEILREHRLQLDKKRVPEDHCPEIFTFAAPYKGFLAWDLFDVAELVLHGFSYTSRNV